MIAPFTPDAMIDALLYAHLVSNGASIFEALYTLQTIEGEKQ